MEEHVSSPGPSLVEMEKQEDLDGERDEDEQRAPNSEDMEIDHVLEEAAHRKNLSVLNVKSILRVSYGGKKDFLTGPLVCGSPGLSVNNYNVTTPT